MWRYLPLLCAILLSASGLGAAQDKAKDNPAKEEAKKLQGTWQVTKFIDNSEEAAPDDELKHFTFRFQGDRLLMKSGKDDEGNEVTFTLNPTKEPKWIDLEIGAPTGTAEGIYKLTGDDLTICLVSGLRGGKAAPRPSEFKASKRAKHSLYVLKKVSK